MFRLSGVLLPQLLMEARSAHTGPSAASLSGLLCFAIFLLGTPCKPVSDASSQQFPSSCVHHFLATSLALSPIPFQTLSTVSLPPSGVIRALTSLPPLGALCTCKCRHRWQCGAQEPEGWEAAGSLHPMELRAVWGKGWDLGRVTAGGPQSAHHRS